MNSNHIIDTIQKEKEEREDKKHKELIEHIKKNGDSVAKFLSEASNEEVQDYMERVANPDLSKKYVANSSNFHHLQTLRNAMDDIFANYVTSVLWSDWNGMNFERFYFICSPTACSKIKTFCLEWELTIDITLAKNQPLSPSERGKG